MYNYCLRPFFVFILILSSLSFVEATEVPDTEEVYLKKTDILKLNIDGSAERIIRYYYYNPTYSEQYFPFGFTIDDFRQAESAFVVDSSNKPIIIDGIEEKVRIEEYGGIYRYVFGPIGFGLNPKSADYKEFHIIYRDFWGGESYNTREKIRTPDYNITKKLLHVERVIPKKPDSLLNHYTLEIEKIDPPPDLIYDTEDAKVIIWNLGEFHQEFEYFELSFGYIKSWRPLKDTLFAGLIGILIGLFIDRIATRNQKDSEEKNTPEKQEKRTKSKRKKRE